ncbi:MAG: hemin uptake protein HemP [Gammaproteobacteria bacterium]|nr:hemin uptake protein HemP [Gammaproteobacteria bacterium]
MSAALRGESTAATLNSRNTCKVGALDSQALLGVDGVVNIQHNGDIYMLRRTRLGKLILTK